MKRRTSYTYNSTHIEDCSDFCKHSGSSGDDTTGAPEPGTPEPGLQAGAPEPGLRPGGPSYPTNETTGTAFWGTTYGYPRSFDKEKETEDLPDVKANGHLEHQYFGWENYDRGKLHFSLMSFIRSNRHY